VRLLQLQFDRVLTGHDALVVVDIAGQTIEQRRLAESMLPEISTFTRQRPVTLRISALSGEIDPLPPNSPICSRASPLRRKSCGSRWLRVALDPRLN
jgi:hypothetical protein